MSIKTLTEALHTVEIMGLADKLEDALNQWGSKGLEQDMEILEAQANVIVDIDEKARVSMIWSDERAASNLDNGIEILEALENVAVGIDEKAPDRMNKQGQTEAEIMGQKTVGEEDFISKHSPNRTAAYDNWINSGAAEEECNFYDYYIKILESRLSEYMEAGFKSLEALRKIIENADCKINSSVTEEAVKYVRNLEAMLTNERRVIKADNEAFEEIVKNSDAHIGFALRDVAINYVRKLEEENRALKFSWPKK